jgi:hypothetical protein
MRLEKRQRDVSCGSYLLRMSNAGGDRRRGKWLPRSEHRSGLIDREPAHCSFAHNFTGSAGSVSQGFVELTRTKQHVLEPFPNSLGIDGLLAHGVVRR